MKKIEIDHDFIREYLSVHREVQTRQSVKENETQNAETLLFDILNDLITIAGADWQPRKPATEPSFFETEKMLLRFFSRNISSQEAKELLNNLYYSQSFYQRFSAKIHQLMPVFSTRDVPELARVKQKSDDEILQQVFNIRGKTTESIAGSGAAVWIKIRQKIKERMLGPKPQWAYAFAAVLILFSAGYFGLRYYNTSYQIRMADNLLKSNYRISIEGSPRLSGEFATKGISMLMDGDEPDEIYLSEALGRIHRAEEAGYAAPRVKQLEAKIYIIKGELSRADSILNTLKPQEKKSAPILNDIGVVNFMKEDWDAAIHYFKMAIAADPSMKQAYYNLALVYSKRGERQKAIDVLQRSLALETDEGWKNAVKNLIRRLKITEDPNTSY